LKDLLDGEQSPLQAFRGKDLPANLYNIDWPFQI
jgi:hypothetical protein